MQKKMYSFISQENKLNMQLKEIKKNSKNKLKESWERNYIKIKAATD